MGIIEANIHFRRTGGIKGLSNELMQLRKICQHPFLFESVEDKVNPSTTINDKLVRASGKVELLYRLLPKFFAANHRVCVPQLCLFVAN
jgi:ATP-dependent helicase STH1/SNF2